MERALGGIAIAKGAFDDTILSKYKTILGTEEVLKEFFFHTAGTREKKLMVKKMASSELEDYWSIRRRFLSTGIGIPLKGLTPEEWFNAAAWKVNLLQDINRALNKIIFKKTEQLSNVAYTAFLWTFLRMGVIFIISLFITAIIIRDFILRKRTRTFLEKNESKYRLIHSTTFDGIILANSMGRIIECNGAAEQMFGYGRGELEFSDLVELIPQDYRKQHLEGFRRFLTTGESQIQGSAVEVEGVKKDGKVFPIELAVNHFIIDKETFFTATIRDVTERKKAETETWKANMEISKVNHRLYKTAEDIRDIMWRVVEENNISLRFENATLSHCWEKKDCGIED